MGTARAGVAHAVAVRVVVGALPARLCARAEKKAAACGPCWQRDNDGIFTYRAIAYGRDCLFNGSVSFY